MNWDAIGALGEIIGALAVVGSLAYLAIQIRSQSRETRAGAMHEISVGFRDNIAQFADSSMAELFLKANEGSESLSETEKFMLVTSVQRVLRVWEEAFLMHQSARLDDNFWIPMNKQYASMFSTPAIQYVWAIRKQFYNDEFRDFVDAIVTTDWKL